jgi:putative membrane protein
MMGMMSFGMLLNMLFWILILGFAIYGFILLISKPFEKKVAKTTGDAALEILKERFAKGEISEEEFERNKLVLQR